MAMAVIGAGTCNSDLRKLAYEIGYLIAERGADLVTGGTPVCTPAKAVARAFELGMA